MSWATSGEDVMAGLERQHVTTIIHVSPEEVVMTIRISRALETELCQEVAQMLMLPMNENMFAHTWKKAMRLSRYVLLSSDCRKHQSCVMRKKEETSRRKVSMIRITTEAA